MPTEPDPSLEFGVFDHLDQGGRQPSDFFEQRLRLLAKYDRAGFYAFHPAGNLGRQLSRVEEHMRPLDACRISSTRFLKIWK